MLSTGARVGEASAICWDDIDFEKKIVSINKTLVCSYKGKERIFSFNPTKTKNGVRKLPILSTLYAVLEKMKNDKATRISFPHEDNLLINDQELIFYCIVNNRIRAVSNFDVNHALKKLITNYNSDKLFKEMHLGVPTSLPLFSSHALRHTFCSRLCENEVNLKVIQEIMGHGNIHMTIDTNTMVSISEANQNFSKVARLVDEKGSAVILKNNVPRYLVIDFSKANADIVASDDDVLSISKKLIAQNKEAYEALAK